MKKTTLYLLLVATLLAMFFLCSVPDDPTDPSHTKMTPVYKDGNGTTYSYGFSDTVGNTGSIGAALYLPQNIDSVIFTISSDGDILHTDTIRAIDATYTRDTVWTTYTFVSSGVKTVDITPYSSSVSVSPYSGIIKVYASSNATQNHAPLLSYSGKTKVLPGEVCSLTITATDEDAGQTVTISMPDAPDDATFEEGTFSWRAPLDAAGNHEVTFKATDDGTPQLSHSLLITIKVTTDTSNNAPKWDIPSVTFSLSSTGAVNLTLSTICTDADNDALIFTLLDGTPDGDEIENGVYHITATSALIGMHTVKIVVKDPYGATDTLEVNLNIEEVGDDNTSPTISLISPNDTTATSSSDSITLEVLCSDASGISSVIAIFEGTEFPATGTNEHYKMTVTGLASGGVNTITLKVKDASANANEVTKVYAITVVNTHKIVYSKNDSAASGTMQVQEANAGATVVLFANTFTKPGFSFSGWATSSSGEVEYTDKADYTIGSSDVTLYAVWTSNASHTVTFDKNAESATGTMGAQSIASGLTVPLTGNAFVNDGYHFTGWATSASGAVEYTDKAAYEMGTSDVTLYAVWTSNASHWVTFDKNAESATGTMDAQSIVSGLTVPLTGNAFVNSGYHFTGWATTPSGDVEYTDKADYAMGSSDVTLYARWAGNASHLVTFDKNAESATGTMDAQSIVSGLTVPLTENAFVNPGFNFAGWATTIDGDVAYSDNAPFTIESEDVTLYAVWSENALYKVTFNRGDSSATGTMRTQPIISGLSAPLTANTFTRSGYTFSGWATSATGAVAFANGASYTMGGGDVTLYAVWSAIPTHNVIFNANGGSGTMTAQSIMEGSSAALKANTFTRSGYTFSGWATSATGAVAFANGASYTMGGGDVTLYAVWTAIPTHNVIFDPNGGSGTMANQEIMEGSSATLKTNTFTRSSYTFSGWATTPGGAVTYANGATLLMGGSDVTLYAVWIGVWSKVTDMTTTAIVSRFVLGPNEVLYYASAVSGSPEVSLYKLNTSGSIVLAASGEAPVNNGLALDLGSDGITLFVGTGSAVASWAGLNWNYVDNAGWNSVGGYSMHIGADNTPYAFAMGPMFNMRIWKLSNGTWDVVGTDIPLPIGPGAGSNSQEFFCIKSGTVVHTVGNDESDPGVSVATLNGSLWNVQKLAETSKQENYQIIASGQTVYAAYTYTNGADPTIYKGGSGSWAKLSSMAKSTSATGGFSIACSPSGVLYAGHVEGTSAIIKKYGGSIWQSATGSGDGVAFSTASGAAVQILTGTNRCYAVIKTGTASKMYEIYQLPLN